MRVAARSAFETCASILVSHGAPQAQAEVQARWLVEADLRGHPSHGLQRLPVLVERLRNGFLVPDADPVVEWRSEVAAVVDGNRGFGPWIGLAAIGQARERARVYGLCLVAVSNSNHLGLLGPYVEEAARSGLIAVALTTSEALVHPWNGRIAMLGTNPIAIGVPADPEPFVLDMATGIVSMGEILDYRNRGESLPMGWALDADGTPTTDPDRAARGAIAPFGGAKGYGLGLAFELLVAAITGTAFGRAVVGTLTTDTVCNKGDLFLCIDPNVFGQVGFALKVSRYLDDLRESPRQAGSTAVQVPGDGARKRRERSDVTGINVADGVWAQIEALHQPLSAHSVDP